MTKSELNEAMAIAKAATKGKWHIGHVNEGTDAADIDSDQLSFIAEVAHRRDQTFIATFSPAFVIPLIEAHLEALEMLEKQRLQMYKARSEILVTRDDFNLGKREDRSMNDTANNICRTLDDSFVRAFLAKHGGENGKA